MQDDDKEVERFRRNLNEQARLNPFVLMLVAIWVLWMVAAIAVVALLVLR